MESLRFLMISTHFPPHHLGGDAVFVENLSRELIKLGHEVHVLHNPSVYEVIRKTHDSNKNDSTDDGIHRHVFRHRSAKFDTLNALTLGIDGRAKSHAANLARTIQPDVIHWHNTRGFIGVPPYSEERQPYTHHMTMVRVCPRSNLFRPDLRECERARWCTICCTKWRKPPQLWRIGSKRVLEYPDDMKIIAPSDFLANRLRKEGVRVTHIPENLRS